MTGFLYDFFYRELKNQNEQEDKIDIFALQNMSPGEKVSQKAVSFTNSYKSPLSTNRQACFADHDKNPVK